MADSPAVSEFAYGRRIGYQPTTTVTLTCQHRDNLRNLRMVVGSLIGESVTYGRAITEAERIARIALNDPELRERFAPAPKPDHIVLYESSTELVSAGE